MTRTISSGSGAGDSSFTARKERMLLSCLLSKTVKSCCCRPGTTLPDLSVTTTLRSMRRSERLVGDGCTTPDCIGDSDAGTLCCAMQGSEKERRVIQAQVELRMTIPLCRTVQRQSAGYTITPPMVVRSLDARHRSQVSEIRPFGKRRVVVSATTLPILRVEVSCSSPISLAHHTNLSLSSLMRSFAAGRLQPRYRKARNLSPLDLHARIPFALRRHCLPRRVSPVSGRADGGQAAFACAGRVFRGVAHVSGVLSDDASARVPLRALAYTRGVRWLAARHLSRTSRRSGCSARSADRSPSQFGPRGRSPGYDDLPCTDVDDRPALSAARLDQSAPTSTLCEARGRQDSVSTLRAVERGFAAGVDRLPNVGRAEPYA